MKKIILLTITFLTLIWAQYYSPKKYIEKHGLDSCLIFLADTTGTGRDDDDTTFLFSTSIHTDSVIALYITGSSATSRRADSLKYGASYFPGTSWIRSDVNDSATGAYHFGGLAMDKDSIIYIADSSSDYPALVIDQRGLGTEALGIMINSKKEAMDVSSSTRSGAVFRSFGGDGYFGVVGEGSSGLSGGVEGYSEDGLGGYFYTTGIGIPLKIKAAVKDTLAEFMIGTSVQLWIDSSGTMYAKRLGSLSDSIDTAYVYQTKTVALRAESAFVYCGTDSIEMPYYDISYGNFAMLIRNNGMTNNGILIDSNMAYGALIYLGRTNSYVGIKALSYRDSIGAWSTSNCVTGFKAEPGQQYSNFTGFMSHYSSGLDTLHRVGFLDDGSKGFRCETPAGDSCLQMNAWGLYDLSGKYKVYDPATNLLMADSVKSNAGVWTLGAGTLRGSSAGGDTIIGDTTQWYVVINGKNKVKIDSKGVRLRDSIFVSTSTLDTAKIYMSNDTVAVTSKLGSYFLDLRQATVLFKPGWMLFDQMKPSTNDSTSSSLGSAPTPYGHIFACSIYVAGKYPTIALVTGNDTVLTDSTQQYLTFTGRKQISINKAGVSILDTLLIPRWSAAPATGTLGSFALDTLGTDTLWAITQDGIKAVFPAAGGSTAMTKNAIMDSLAAGVGSLAAEYTNGLFAGDSNNLGASTHHCAIVGGRIDTITAGSGGNDNFIGGGFHNKVQGSFTAIVGGKNNNTSTAAYSVIAGGLNDTCTGSYSFVSAGTFNRAVSNNCGVIGGTYNRASGTSDFMGGADNSSITSTGSGIISGTLDTIEANYSFIGAGKVNRITGTGMSNVIIGASNGRIRGTAIDSNCVAMGMNPFVDSCRGSVAINATIRQLDSTLAVTKQIYVIDGADTSWVRGGSIGGDCWGSGNFSGTSIIDTVVTAGIAATDRFDLTWYGATLPLFPLTERVAVNTLFVYCNVLDTLKSRTEGYTYTRKTKP